MDDSSESSSEESLPSDSSESSSEESLPSDSSSYGGSEESSDFFLDSSSE
jgi:hypothetical protein